MATVLGVEIDSTTERTKEIGRLFDQMYKATQGGFTSTAHEATCKLSLLLDESNALNGPQRIWLARMITLAPHPSGIEWLRTWAPEEHRRLSAAA